MLQEFKERVTAFMNVEKLTHVKVGYTGIDDMIQRMSQGVCQESAVGLRSEMEDWVQVQLEQA